MLQAYCGLKSYAHLKVAAWGDFTALISPILSVSQTWLFALRGAWVSLVYVIVA